MNYPYKIFVTIYLFMISCTNVYSQSTEQNRLDYDFLHDYWVQSKVYKKELKQYLEKNTTEVKIFSLGKAEKCKFCLSRDKEADYFKVLYSNRYRNVLNTTKFNKQSDKAILQSLFDSFDTHSNRGHTVAEEAIVYGIHFYNGEKKIYSSTINFIYLTMDLIVPGGHTIGTPLILNEEVRKEIYKRLPWQKGQDELMKDKAHLSKWTRLEE